MPVHDFMYAVVVEHPGRVNDGIVPETKEGEVATAYTNHVHAVVVEADRYFERGAAFDSERMREPSR